MDPFVNLDVLSCYSFLWGTSRPEALVARAARMGQPAVALTDTWSLFGAVRFWRACRKQGIQGILGTRIRIYSQGWVLLLARDFEGYGNICRLISHGLLRDSRRPGDIPLSMAKGLSRGVICIAGVHGSCVRVLASEGAEEGAGIKLLALKTAFREKGSLFVAIQSHLPSDRAANSALLDLARRLGIPPVAVSHAVFSRPEDYFLHRVLAGVQKMHHHINVEPLPNDSFILASAGQMFCRIGRNDLVEASLRVAEECSGFSFPAGRIKPPRLGRPEEADRELGRQAFRILARKFDQVPHSYILRLGRELSEIRARGLSDFFLLVRQICAFAEERGIRHSIRGSAAGSLVVHLLHNGPDPVQHGLLFERFMNSGRKDLPDIDMDFDSERRDEVTSWLMERFARPARDARAALVATIHTFRPRSAVRLAARAMGYPLSEIGRLTGALPWSLRGTGLREAVERLPELKNSPLRHEPGLLRAAAALEGLPFQASVHLGGVILAPGHIADWSPLWISKKGFPVAQIDKDDVDWLGLLKIDLLGLRMHTAIEKSIKALCSRGVDIRKEIDRLPLEDMPTFELLRNGNTLGVFQLESSGQRNLVCRLQPRCFDDIVAEISLFRPGPVQGDMVNHYLRNRAADVDDARPVHPCLEDILSETFGVIVFQEQVLRIVHRFAGFSYAEADAFRRAMTRGRSRGEMKMLKASFIRGAERMGHSRAEAEKVFSGVAAFAAYGFCKAHAVAFSHIAWQSAWLKAHHPAAFYVGLLNAGNVGSYPPYVILNEARRAGLFILGPHVNRSGLEYTIESGIGPTEAIRCPLTVVRQVGTARARAIVSQREQGGPFRDREDFCSRVRLPEEAGRMLALSGALEGLVVRIGRLSGKAA